MLKINVSKYLKFYHQKEKNAQLLKTLFDLSALFNYSTIRTSPSMKY